MYVLWIALLPFKYLTDSNDEAVFQNEVVLPIMKRFLPQSGSHTPTYQLPYGIEADGMLECLDARFLEALTFHAKQLLWQSLFSQVYIVVRQGRLPSPAVIETISVCFWCGQQLAIETIAAYSTKDWYPRRSGSNILCLHSATSWHPTKWASICPVSNQYNEKKESINCSLQL